MSDWALAEMLIVIGFFLALAVISALAIGVIELWQRLRTYEKKPFCIASPKTWKAQEDDWSDRIMRG